ncbi:MAG: hypothetical protein IRY98_04975 [Alicyclobacillaceae bacterium]|nr:hypothetical protein [Alicyclobacillaceae bacterium]
MLKPVLDKMVDLATASFGLAAALAWNELIKQLIEDMLAPYFPKSWGLISMLLYASAVTALAVWVTSYLGRLVANQKAEEKAAEEKADLERAAREDAEADTRAARQQVIIEEAIVRAMTRWREMEQSREREGGS